MRDGFPTVLFDLDGTLIDSEDLILASYRHTTTTHLGTVPSEEAFRATIGQPLVVQFRAYARDEDELAAMIRTYAEHNSAHHDALVRPFPGVRELLVRLRGQGRTLGIVTSKRAPIARRGLEHCRIPSGWFSAFITAESVGRYKPDPEPVLAALEVLGERDAARAVFVGDSTHDMLAGRAAGTRTAAALWGPYTRAQLEVTRPDFWLPSPDSVLDLVGGRADGPGA